MQSFRFEAPSVRPAARLLCSSLLFGGIAHAAGQVTDPAAPVKTLGSVTVLGSRPTSLPTHIPTTIEGVTGEQIAETINATDSEDALKYFPSLLVRKRYVGDYDHAVLATRASGTGNSARSLVYADGILLSNLLGNGATFTPRWGMVTPEEIERVDVLYGPFSAAYPGNSVGAVVDYVTRMPERFEAHVRASSFGEDFQIYGTDDRYTGWQGSASVGDRAGNWSWWVNFNRLDSDAHPIAFANKLVSSGIDAPGELAVTSAIVDRNPRNQDWLILGATNQVRTVQDHAKAKLAYDFSPTVRATYTLGWWRNDATRTSDSYLRDAQGNPVYGDPINPERTLPVNIDGRRYSLLPTDFAPSRAELEHVIHGLSFKSNSGGVWDWELAASLYDYATDETRSPTVAVPDPHTNGAGRIADMDGTGWNTMAVRATWRPEGAHLIDFGLQRDGHALRTQVNEAAGWISGPADQRVSAFRGDTTLHSIYAQDTWSFAGKWRSTLGARVEQWRAFDGALADETPGFERFAERKETSFSPKAALAYQLAEAWTLKASLGRAVRTPTVAELYQGSIVAGDIVNNDPNLQPEKSWTGEITAERELDIGLLRTTVFHEDMRDALYSQRNVTAGGTATTIQNVDHVRTTGVELAYQAGDVVFRGFDLSGSVTYARSRIVANDKFPDSVGKWQPRVPEWRANLLASYRLGDAWTYSLGARYSGTQYNTLDNVDPNGFTFTGTSSFLVVDVRGRYRATEQCTLSLGIDNLNNQEYWAFHPYTQRSFSAEVSFDF